METKSFPYRANPASNNAISCNVQDSYIGAHIMDEAEEEEEEEEEVVESLR